MFWGPPSYVLLRLVKVSKVLSRAQSSPRLNFQGHNIDELDFQSTDPSEAFILCEMVMGLQPSVLCNTLLFIARRLQTQNTVAVGGQEGDTVGLRSRNRFRREVKAQFPLKPTLFLWMSSSTGSQLYLSWVPASPNKSFKNLAMGLISKTGISERAKLGTGMFQAKFPAAGDGGHELTTWLWTGSSAFPRLQCPLCANGETQWQRTALQEWARHRSPSPPGPGSSVLREGFFLWSEPVLFCCFRLPESPEQSQSLGFESPPEPPPEQKALSSRRHFGHLFK